MSDVVWWLGTIAVLAGLYAVAFRMEPHWVSKDATSFTCRVREVREDLDEGGGRWRDRHAAVADGQLRLGGRVTLRSFGNRSRGDQSSPVEVLGRAPADGTRFAVYVIAGETTMLLRVPVRSRAVPVLDGLVRAT